MATLETTFAGLKLKNPIIVSSCGLTDSADKNKETLRSRSRSHRTEIAVRGTDYDGGRLDGRS